MRLEMIVRCLGVSVALLSAHAAAQMPADTVRVREELRALITEYNAAMARRDGTEYAFRRGADGQVTALVRRDQSGRELRWERLP
jgi:hypothetical protein